MPLTIAVSGLHMGESPQPGCGIIRSLRRHYVPLNVVGLIYDTMESGIYAPDCADVVYQMPFPKVGSDALLERLDYILARQPIDVLIPALDSEIHGYLKMTGPLAERRVKMLLPSMESYQACRKSQLAELAKACDCRVPQTLTAVETSGLRRAAQEIGYPLMIKGPYYGAYWVSRDADLFDRFHEIVTTWGGPVLVQECIKGGEFDVIAVGDGLGDVGGMCTIRKTIVSERGKGFGGITMRDASLDALAMRLIRKLNWRGPIELEFIQDEDSGEYVLIEINPRFPAWVDFPSTFGHNLPVLVVETLLNGQVPKLPPYATGKFFVRHSVDLPGDVAQLGQLSTFGELRTNDREATTPIAGTAPLA
jgi:carbamoyl-phosphate synthase large subunit